MKTVEDYTVIRKAYFVEGKSIRGIHRELGVARETIRKAGLRLEFLHEFEALADPVYPEMVQREDGLYSFPDIPVPLPILFSLKAYKDS